MTVGPRPVKPPARVRGKAAPSGRGMIPIFRCYLPPAYKAAAADWARHAQVLQPRPRSFRVACYPALTLRRRGTSRRNPKLGVPGEAWRPNDPNQSSEKRGWGGDMRFEKAGLEPDHRIHATRAGRRPCGAVPGNGSRTGPALDPGHRLGAAARSRGGPAGARTHVAVRPGAAGARAARSRRRAQQSSGPVRLRPRSLGRGRWSTPTAAASSPSRISAR